MLIERALRERTSAVQSGSSDIGLFGATPQTFSSYSISTTGTSDVGSIVGSAQGGAIASIEGGLGSLSLQFDTPVMSSGALAAPLGIVTADARPSAIIAQQNQQSHTANPDHDPGNAAVTSGAFYVAPQAGIQIGTPSDASEHVQQTTISGEVTTGQVIASATSIGAPVVAALSEVEASAGEVIAGLSEIEASIAQARADALEQIEQIAATATTQVAEIQAKLAETIATVGGGVADLTNAVGGQINDVSAPVLDLVADIPGTIETVIATDIDIDLDTAVQLGNATIGLTQQVAVDAALAIDADLPLEGADVAGGMATLVDLVTEEAGFIVEDVATGIAWPLASTAPLDSVDALIETPGNLLNGDLGDEDAGGALLGLNSADGLTHGLFDTDDFGLGLG